MLLIPLAWILSSTPPAAGTCMVPPQLRGSPFEPPRTKLVVPAWHCALCLAVLGPNATGCVWGSLFHAQRGTGVTLTTLHQLWLKGGSTCPFQQQAGQLRSPMAKIHWQINRSCSLWGSRNLGEKFGRKLVHLAYEKVVCPSSAIFPLSPASFTLLLQRHLIPAPQPPQDPFPLFFSPLSTVSPLVPHFWAEEKLKKSCRSCALLWGCNTHSCEM